MAQWQALESNPDTLNAFIEKIGVSGVEVVDIFSFDDECLPFYPTPQLAIVLCYPDDGPGARDYMKTLYESMAKDETTKTDDIFFMKQKIKNACGTFALFHSLANLDGVINLGYGSFRQWLDKAKTVGVEERSDILANDTTLAAAHDETASSGETDQPAHVEYHFIAYVAKDGILYEIDSCAPGPRPVGPTTPETLIKDAGIVIKGLMKNINDPAFSAMGLVGN